MTINIIDPHLHLLDHSRGDYHWLKSENPPFWPDKYLLQQDFSIEDLNNSLANKEIKLAGFVHIEAGFDNTSSWRELEYIESLSCQKNRTIASVDLSTEPEHFQASLRKLQQYQSLIGVRHIFDEQALAILSSHSALQNFSCLNEIPGFIFELQLPLADNSAINVMPLLMQTISNNSQLRFIINHAAFPPKSASKNIMGDAWCLWKRHITELAKYPNVFIKCSGWEMADRQYKMSWFNDVTRFCLNTFSIERVMLASNFPLCLLSTKIGEGVSEKLNNKSYANYWQDIIDSSVMKQCSKNEKNALLYNNALGIYQLANDDR